jgi:hypothetical protein
MLVKFLKEWKDFDEGEEREIQDGIAEGLILGGIAKNVSFETERDKNSTITGISYKKNTLRRIQTEIGIL